MTKRRKPRPAPISEYRTQVGIADVWDADDPVKIPDDLPPSVTREDYVAFVRRRRKGEYLANLVLRVLVESVGLYQFCGNDDCRRAGGCCSRRVECWERHNDLLRVTVLPGFKQALREARERDPLDGGVAEDQLGPDWDPRRHAARFRAMQAKRATDAPSGRKGSRRSDGPPPSRSPGRVSGW